MGQAVVGIVICGIYTSFCKLLSDYWVIFVVLSY